MVINLEWVHCKQSKTLGVPENPRHLQILDLFCLIPQLGDNADCCFSELFVNALVIYWQSSW